MKPDFFKFGSSISPGADKSTRDLVALLGNPPSEIQEKNSRKGGSDSIDNAFYKKFQSLIKQRNISFNTAHSEQNQEETFDKKDFSHKVKSPNDQDMPDTLEKVFKDNEEQNKKLSSEIRSEGKIKDTLESINLILEGMISSKQKPSPTVMMLLDKTQNNISYLLKKEPKKNNDENFSKEEIAEKRRLRAEVEAMVAEFKSVDRCEPNPDEKKRKKLKLLDKYGIKKWPGRANYSEAEDPKEAPKVFLEKNYNHWIENKVIFRNEIEQMDAELISIITQDVHNKNYANPLLKRSDYTQLIADGVFEEHKRNIAAATINLRKPKRILQNAKKLNAPGKAGVGASWVSASKALMAP